MSEETPITRLLEDWQSGKQDALQSLMPLVYSELKNIARRHLVRERRNHTLHTTALVNEAYLKLVNQSGGTWQNRSQFFALSAQIMRRVLVDYAREVKSKKRGGEVQKIQFEGYHDTGGDRKPLDIIALEDALRDLEQLDPMQCRIVEMRYFAGLSLEEVSKALDISLARAKREWTMIKSWLYHYLNKDKLGRS